MFTVQSCERVLEYFALSNTETPGISKKHIFKVKETEESGRNITWPG